jgi:signal transduction histidine kinase
LPEVGLEERMKNKRLEWTWVNAVFSGIRVMWLFLWVLIFTQKEIFHSGISISFGVLLVWLFLSYLIPQVFLIPINLSLRNYYVSEFLFTGSLYVYLFLIVGSDSSLLLIPLISLGLYFSNRFSWWSIVSLLLTIPIIGLFLQSESLVVLLTHFLNNVIALGVGYAFNRIVMLLKENQEQKKVLEQYAQKVENLTLLEERNRMAGELHDTIGHTFTSVIVGIDGIIANLKQANTERALYKLQILRDLTRNGLDDIRKNIHNMADDQEIESFIDRLTSITNEFAAHTGTSIHFQSLGQERELHYHAQHALMRCLQEALTNAKRHGNAQTIDVRFEFENEAVSLTVRDDGIGTEKVHLGFGLNSMKQRLQSLNGDLSVASTSGAGMEIICKIPNRGEFIYEQDKIAHRG